MNVDRIIAVLNELLVRERDALSLRLFESTVFISRLSIDSSRVARSIVARAEDHTSKLVQLILDLDGSPRPPKNSISSADLHYQELNFVLPRLAEDQKRLLAAYRRGAELVGEHQGASALVAEIAADHERSIADIERLLQEHAAAV